jgi:quercetin dioxygenase-like cupin family protein
MQKVNIYENLVYSDEKVQITPMLESDSSKEIRIVFKKEQFMKDHKTVYPITVEIVDGAIDFGVGEKAYNLIKGDIVSLEASVVHNLLAMEDSIVRLSLSKSDSVDRVKGVLRPTS